MNNTRKLFTMGELRQMRQREPTLTTRAANLIENLIVENRLQPGDRLPSVRELSDQFGVSRTVVREAITVLIGKHLLEVRHGSGTTVRAPTTESVAQSMTLLLRAGQGEIDYRKVLEVRRLLEIEIAGLAAERRSEDDLARMDAILVEMQAIVGDRDRFAANDVAFHRLLAQATHNELYTVLLDSLADIVLEVRRLAFDVPDGHSHALRHHAAILDQIRRGDSLSAREAMREHLGEAEETMRQAMALRAERTNEVAP